jgi:hypothetical protein
MNGFPIGAREWASQSIAPSELAMAWMVTTHVPGRRSLRRQSPEGYNGRRFWPGNSAHRLPCRRWGRASTLNSALDQLSAEIPLGEQPVVRGAQDAEIVDRFATAARPRIVVVDLNELARRAALPVAAHERAPQTVSRDDLPHRVVRNVPAGYSLKSPAFQTSPSLPRTARLAAPRRPCLGKALFFDSLDEQVHRALDHDREIAGWVGMTE